MNSTSKTVSLGRLLVSSIFLMALLASCSSPLSVSPSKTAAPSYPVDVSWDSPTSERGIGADSAVSAVTIRVWSNSGTLLGTGALTNSAGAWKGTISVSGTGLANFKAYAKDAGGHLLYLGAQQTNLVGKGDSVSIGVLASSEITYDGNGETSGDVPEDSASYLEGDPVTVSGSGTLAKSGYTFAGWTTNPAGAGTSYAAAAEFTKPDANVILYAVWISDTLKFTSSGEVIAITGYNEAPSGTLTIPAGVTRIQGAAFMNVSGLTGLVLPESLLSIQQSAFMGCANLAEVNLPDSLLEIGDYAFWSCYDLETVAIPRNVTTIGGEALANCTSLATLTVDEDNAYYKSVDGAIYNKAGTTLVQVANALEGTFEVPDGVTKIGFGAFMGCGALTAITLPSTVTVLEAEAFRQCVALATIELPEGITTLPEAVFYDCIAMTSFTIPGSVTTIEGHALQDCRSLASLSIPSTVTSIGNFVFDACSALTSLTVDGSNPNYQSDGTALLTKDGATLLYVVNGLAGGFTVPEDVTAIADYALYDCRLMTGVSIPESVTSIGTLAFGYCVALEEVTLPSGLTVLGSSAFDSCSVLAAVNSLASAPPTLSSGSNAFANCAAGLQILVPSGSLSTYQAATGWSDYLSALAEQEPSQTSTPS